MAYKLYVYRGCGTCRKALAWLEERGIEYKEIQIREQPPAQAELKRVLKTHRGEIRRLFNTSGQLYREMGIKDKLAAMTPGEAIAMLAGEGNLVKRPVLIGPGVALNGFKAGEWEAALD